LLDFDRARVPLRLIIVEGHGEVVEKREDLMFVGPQPVEQVTYRALFAASAWLRLGCGLVVFTTGGGWEFCATPSASRTL
jgi:hypothetical protein